MSAFKSEFHKTKQKLVQIIQIIISGNEPLGQQKASACKLSQSEAATVPSAVGLAKRKELQKRVDDVVGELLGKSWRHSADTFKGIDQVLRGCFEHQH